MHNSKVTDRITRTCYVNPVILIFLVLSSSADQFDKRQWTSGRVMSARACNNRRACTWRR